MSKLTVAEHLEAIINSAFFDNFCKETQCPLYSTGCRGYCPIFTLRAKLGDTTQ